MLKILDPKTPGIVHPFEPEETKWSITHAFNGYDILSFEIPARHEIYQYITEECRIIAENNQYSVKSIDEHSQYVVIDCQLDLDDWRERFWREYRKENISLAELLNDIKPYNWSIAEAGKYVQRYTIESSEGHPVENVNSEDLLNKALSLWGVAGNFDVLNRILYVINPDEYTATGEYITEELNLKSLGYTGNSTNFATRLYAYGKTDDNTKIPLTISSVNNGKEYVENHRYSDRIISVGWKDEQYTDAQALKNAAVSRLEKLSFPERSYECEVNNLDQDIWLYKVVTLIDRKRHTRVDHQVVEYKEYPKKHSLDVVTLSTLPPTIEGTYNQIRTELTEQVEQTKTTMEAAIEDATRLITGQDGGYVVLDPAERPERILIMDQPEKTRAKNIWCWNLAGLGHSHNGVNGPYGLAMTMDGKIVADYITTGTLSGITIQGNTIMAGGQNNTSGEIKAISGDGQIEYAKLDHTGLTAIGGKIADWTIEPHRLHSNGAGINASGHGKAFWAGGSDLTGDTAPYWVDHNGDMFASHVTIDGGSEEDVTCLVLNHDQTAEMKMFGSGMHIRNRDNSGWTAKISTAGVSVEIGKEHYAQMTPDFVSIVNGDRKGTLDVFGASPQSLVGLKQNIEPASGLLEDVMNTDVYFFEYKTHPDYRMQGFVIGQGYRLSPRVLTADGESINLYASLGVLWGGVQEAVKRIEDLERRCLVNADRDERKNAGRIAK